MGRKSEIDEDDAAKAVTSSLRQAPAHSRDDSFARRRGTTPDLAGAGDENHRPKTQETAKTRGGLSHAPGNFLGNEESKEEVEPIMSNGGGSEKAMNEKEEKKILDDTPRFGMFAAVHQEGQNRRPSAGPVQAAESNTVVSSVEEGMQPGAFAVGDGDAEDTYTVSPVESVAPQSEPPSQDNGQIPIASEAVVDPPPTSHPVVKAERQRDWLSQKRNRYMLLLIFLLVVGIVVAVVIPLSAADEQGGESDPSSQSRQSNGDTGSEVQTPVPTSAPSISPAPTSLSDRLFELITPSSGEAVLEDSSTPQYQAFQWAIGDSTLGDWADNIILERYALASIFYSTTGGRWLFVTDFLLQLPYCVWQGVECSDDVITSLSLPSENLVGSLPREIGLLTTLTSLNVANNSLTGSVPTEIGFMTNLELLDLSRNSEIPAARRALSLRRSLEDAIPQQSFLTGPIPSEIGLLTSLLTLDLSGNAISGSMPSEVGQLSKILNLFLHDNRLEGSVPLQLGFLSTLQRLSLERNLLIGDVPNTLCSSFSLIQDLSADCLAESNSQKPAEVVCKCCNVCCDVNHFCRDLDVTGFPSSSPSTSIPSASPSTSPTETPSTIPSSVPSVSPSSIPSHTPSFVPSMSPSFNPTPSGTPEPTVAASQSPSKSPTLVPSSFPSLRPTGVPTIAASIPPTSSCSIDENSCVGNRACNGAVELCTESGSCSGRNACRSSSDLSVAQGSCVGTSACQQATGIVSSNSCTDDNSCADFGGISIGSNSCNCPECCSCYSTGELPDIIPSNSCNIRGECCSTPSPTVAPTKNPTQHPTTAAPTTRQPTPNPTTPRPTQKIETNNSIANLTL